MFHAVLSLALLVGAADASDSTEPAPLDQDVAKAARYYRIQVYHTYRMQRGEYNRRREVGNKVVEDWKEAGQPEDHRGAVVQWFQQARQAAFAGGNAPQAPSLDPVVDLHKTEEEFAGIEPPAATPPTPVTPAPATPAVPSVVEPAETTVSTPELPGPPLALPPLEDLVAEEPVPAKQPPVEKMKDESVKTPAAKSEASDVTEKLDPLPPLPAPAAPWNGAEPVFSPPVHGAGSSSR